jgi:hypothetical protein
VIKQYNGSPVSRTFDEKGKPTGFNITPDPDWTERDILLWTVSLVNNETGLNCGVEGPNSEGVWTISGEFITGPVPMPGTVSASSYLMGILTGYSAASRKLGKLGIKTSSSGFSDLFGGIF